MDQVKPYFVAQRVGQTLNGLLGQVFQSQMPRFTLELGAGDWIKARHRMARMLVLAGTGATTVGIFYWAASPAIVNLWLGPGAYVGPIMLLFMAVDYGLLAFTVPWAWFVLASGKNPFVLSTLSNGVLNLILIAALTPRLGLIGLPLAGILSGLASNHVYNIVQGRQLLSRLRRQVQAIPSVAAAARYVLMTDSVPLREGGNGIQVLGWNWLEAMKDRTVLVLAAPLSNEVKNQKAAAESPVPLLFWPEAKFLTRMGWLSRLRWPIELILFALKLPEIGAEIRRAGTTRIFAFAGARFWFLAQVRMLRWYLRLPTEIYLVDDLEAWQRLHGRTSFLPFLRLIEKGALRQMERTWAISPGYVDHLQKKYGISARWLPVTVRKTASTWIPYRPTNPDIRSFVFMGSINALYHDGLLAFARQIGELNRSGILGYQARLDIYTFIPFEACEEAWKNSPHIQLHCQKPDEVRHAALQSAWAILLAFAFQPESRLMIATSFSTKFTESVTCGRPVIFFGPEDSSVIVHARSQGLPLVATSPEALPGVLAQVEKEDGPALIDRYGEVAEKFHSARALRAYLADSQ